MNFRSFFTLLFEDFSSKLPILLKQFPNENAKSIEQASEADPTPNKKFITWILKLKSVNNIILPEDTEKIKETLLDFLKLSNTGKWKADKNIMTYKTYGALAKTVDSFKDITHIKIDKPLSENDKRIPIKTIGNITVYKITDKETLMHWSQEPIKWCVKEAEYAENYLKKGPLYMFFKNNEPYVLCHFETGQIKNEWDDAIDIYTAEELYPFLKNAFKNFKMDKDAEHDFHIFIQLLDITEADKRCILLGKHTVHEDGSITCEGSVNLSGMHLNKLPYNFREIKGNFYCSDNNLSTLEGCPSKVGGVFECSHTNISSLQYGPKQVGLAFRCSFNPKLTSLKYGPRKVGTNYTCSHCSLQSLEGAPKNITGQFDCSYNKLTTLKGGPKKILIYFSCENNLLTTLEGGPQEVGEGYFCSDNQLTTLEGAPQEVGASFDCSDNQLTSLKGAPQVVLGRLFDCSHNKLTTLKGGPQEVDGNYNCMDNPLTSLDGQPQYISGEFHCKTTSTTQKIKN